MSSTERAGPLAGRLPDFPWDTIADAAARARAHPGGIVDLSVGTPVDPVPQLVQDALAAAANSPGYPTALGTDGLREAYVRWAQRRLGIEGLSAATQVITTVGSKELVAWLPTLLGIGAGGRVVVPELAYPTYAVGGLVAGAEVVAADATSALGPARVDLVWLNSPSNPTGRVLPAEHLAKVVAWARERGAVVVSDECYVELGWDAQPVSALHPSVSGGSADQILVVHSLSKRSNMAGYRAGFVAGDPRLVGEVLAARKHLGMLMPGPVQVAAAAALDDDVHVVEQRAVYRRRRDVLVAALGEAGFRIDHSEAGLYLWATAGEGCRVTLDRLADLGILVAPGDFYGPAGAQHVRIALTATDERVEAAAARLTLAMG